MRSPFAPALRAVIALDEPYGSRLAADLETEGVAVVATVGAGDLAGGEPAALSALADADAVVLRATRETLTSALIAACDRLGVRILALTDSPLDDRMVTGFGLSAPLPLGAEAWQVARALTAAPVPAVAAVRSGAPQVIAVWGPAGAPGRSTVAVELAVELARGGRHVGLVDADTHAPSLALAVGLPDEGPGFAAACRQAELGGLDASELNRISVSLTSAAGRVDVLTGLNRPGRWPELSERRVSAALRACREWAEFTVVDVAAPLERDEEIVSDLDGPRRNAATLAALREADVIVAVAAADPIGISRFLRGYSELRAVVGSVPVLVVANRLRSGALGIDARGQVRRTLDRFGGVTDVSFLPHDPRAADAAMLGARPIAEVAPRSPLTLAMRRLAGELVGPGQASVTPLRTKRRGRDERIASRRTA